MMCDCEGWGGRPIKEHVDAAKGLAVKALELAQSAHDAIEELRTEMALALQVIARNPDAGGASHD